LIFIILFPQATAGHQQEPGSLPDADPVVHHDGGLTVMTWPLIILAVISALLGFGQSGLQQFLTGTLTAAQAHTAGHHTWLLFVTLALALGGLGLAWLEFGRRTASRIGFVERLPWLQALFAERWYIDRFYRFFLDTVIYRGISNMCTRNDNEVIDGGIDGFSQSTVATGRMLSFLHAGMVQYKLLVVFAVVVLLALYFLL
jgi:NADH-quinone oxidoreductase subunit L